MRKGFDFEAWATKNNVRCADGRTIRQNAFKDDDGQVVPLVYMHCHNDPTNVLGHALLENRPEGVYMYGKFNNTEKGKHAKECVDCGDITSVSIFANGLRQSSSGDVLHGNIREVSIVLSPANPEAKITQLTIAHGLLGDDEPDDEAVIFSGEDITLSHADAEDTKEDEQTVATDEKTLKDIFETMDDDQKRAAYTLMLMASQGTLNAIADAAEEGEEDEDENTKHSDEGGENFMRRNAFEENGSDTLQHSVMTEADVKALIKRGEKEGKLSDAFLAHADETGTATEDDAYGITNLDYLFPEYKTIESGVPFIDRDQTWVANVMSSVHHTPFSKVKSVFADIREDEARAKGYITKKRKKTEVFTLLKRTTSAQTIYKLQKFDRDDILEITNFDIILFVKGEMRRKLDEEIARAILIGDGRLPDDDDHISESHVRPIYLDADLYTVRQPVSATANDDDGTVARETIKAAIRARKQYRGSGSPTFYASADIITEMLLLEDGNGRRLYPTLNELATAMRVKEIVEVPVMENVSRTVGEGGDAKTYPLLGLIVNLADYNVGADKGGEVNLFDDFDIDFNRYSYLIETRISGALVKPFSAIALEKDIYGTPIPSPESEDS